MTRGRVNSYSWRPASSPGRGDYESHAGSLSQRRPLFGKEWPLGKGLAVCKAAICGLDLLC